MRVTATDQLSMNYLLFHTKKNNVLWSIPKKIFLRLHVAVNVFTYEIHLQSMSLLLSRVN